MSSSFLSNQPSHLIGPWKDVAFNWKWHQNVTPFSLFPVGVHQGSWTCLKKEAFILLVLVLLKDLKTGKLTFALLLSLSVGYWDSLTSPRYLFFPRVVNKVALSQSLSLSHFQSDTRTTPTYPKMPMCYLRELSSKVSRHQNSVFPLPFSQHVIKSMVILISGMKITDSGSKNDMVLLDNYYWNT